jgi:hypothetical protein
MRASKPESLLERRIREHKIPAWPGQAMYNRIIVYRLPDKAAARESFTEGGLIVKPETVASNTKYKSPRGVIVSAGLQAMDVLRGNGIGLGDIIWMASHTPWRFEVERTTEGESIEFFFMQAGDVVISEDLIKRLKNGTAKIEIRDGKHQLVLEDTVVPRFDPPEHPDDM